MERILFGDNQFFAVNHSIPDALAVGIRTPAGTVLSAAPPGNPGAATMV